MAIKVLYTGIRRENYNPRRGLGFEYQNFYLTLAQMKGIETIEHPYDRILEIGKSKFNEELWQIIEREKPDLLFAFMYSDELDPAVLLKIKNETKTKSVAWCADDYWRFWNYSKYWPPYFTYVVTTYSKALEWYRKAGFTNIIRSQWGVNTAIWRPLEVKEDIEVSFVGQWKPRRAKIIRALAAAGLKVETFGFGWSQGQVSREKMVEIFSRSKINLNLNVRPSLFSREALARLFLTRSHRGIVFAPHLLDNVRAYLHFGIPHTHARPFEIAGSRGFVISGRSEDITDYYTEGKEMVFYDSISDLAEKTKYYLGRPEERKRIARAAYERTIREHTYEKRFEDLLRIMAIKKGKNNFT